MDFSLAFISILLYMFIMIFYIAQYTKYKHVFDFEDFNKIVAKRIQKFFGLQVGITFSVFILMILILLFVGNNYSYIDFHLYMAVTIYLVSLIFIIILLTGLYKKIKKRCSSF